MSGIRCLVIGGTGFIGRKLTKCLECSKTLLVHRREPDEQIEILRGSFLKLDRRSLSKFTHVVQLAKAHSRFPVHRFLLSLLAGFKNRQISSWVRHFTYFSGTLVYGNGRCDERSRISPVGYARIYYFQECFLQRNKVAILRPSWVLGEGSWFEKFYLRGMKDGYVPMYGNGKNVMNIISLEDVAVLSCKLILSESLGIYNVCSPFNITQEELCTAISDITGLPIKRMEFHEVVKRYGYLTWEALTFSLEVLSIHEVINTFSFKDWKAELVRILSNFGF